ncbi:MAG: dihydroorotase [Bacteroidota bacterium]
MRVLLHSVKVCAPATPHHGSIKDILVENGTIHSIVEGGTAHADKAEVVEGNGLHVSLGWFDMRASFGEPGNEHREDLRSGAAAAAQGGFTGVLLMPSTRPALDSKSGIEFVRRRTEGGLVTIHPAGCITVGGEGNDLAELYDMWRSGAVAFTDDQHPLTNAGMLQRALLYCKDFDGRVLVQAEDRHIAGKGQVHEGAVSTRMGLKGIPGLAESVMVSRDLQLLEYTGGSLHFSCISTAASVELIRRARQQGLKVTADVSALHLYFNEEAMEGFDTHLKVKPPLRAEEDRLALIDGIKDGTIGAITSDHRPFDIESKKKEFDLAEFGAAGLETAFSAAFSALHGHVPMDRLIDALAVQPRTILGLPIPTIAVGSAAELTVFDPAASWRVTAADLRSKGCNNPFAGRTLTGRPVAILNKGAFHRI